MINHRLLFLFRWKYMRENPFLCRVYICNKRRGKRWRMFSTSYFIYGKGEGKGGCPEGEGLPIYDGIYFCLYLFSVVII